MSDTPGLPSALGIEAVQWLARGEAVTVRVQGRWRRRPSYGGQALLLLEVLGRRHRYPAMPEPPGITGAAPGTWQMSFSVPATLAPPHAQRAWLQLGAVSVPLPLPVAIDVEDVEDDGLEGAAQSERELRGSEMALESARRRAAEAELAAQRLAGTVAELEQTLEEARALPAELQSELQSELRDGARALRAAQQRAHAERARRQELEGVLAARDREALERSEELAELRRRIHELEDEVRGLIRRLDEAEHAARAALAGRELAVVRASGRSRADGYRAELAVQRAAGSSRVAVPAATAVPRAEVLPGDVALLHRERALVAGGGPGQREAETAAALRAELTARERSEAALRDELDSLRSRPSADPAAASTDRAIASTLAELRAELRALAEAIEGESRARIAAEARAGAADARVTALEDELRAQRDRASRVSQSIGRLRGQLAELGVQTAPLDAATNDSATAAVSEPPAPMVLPEPPAELRVPAAFVDPERFAAALSRLREAAPAEPTDPADIGEPAPDTQPAGDWLGRAFRTLAREDRDGAGALVLALLPAQRLVHPDPLAYDLVLDSGSAIHVTVRDAGTLVEAAAAPRSREEVAFQVLGDPARIVRRLRSGSWRPRLGRRRARIRGERAEFAALASLVGARVRLTDLLDADVTLEPRLAFSLAAAMIDPAWSQGPGFVVAHRATADGPAGPFLWVRDRARALVSDEPLPAGVALTICCPDKALAPLLAGRPPVAMTLEGDERLLGLIRGWIERAQRAEL